VSYGRRVCRAPAPTPRWCQWWSATAAPARRIGWRHPGGVSRLPLGGRLTHSADSSSPSSASKFGPDAWRRRAGPARRNQWSGSAGRARPLPRVPSHWRVAPASPAFLGGPGRSIGWARRRLGPANVAGCLRRRPVDSFGRR
jgi:hypothetical protein